MLATQLVSSGLTERLQESSQLPWLGVQLWSVKEPLEADFGGTLKALADMGFQGVEFAGEFGPYQNDPGSLKQLLQTLGLQACGAHVSFEQFRGENFQTSVEFYQKLGVTTLVIGYDERAWQPERVDNLVEALNSFANDLARYGMRLAYHNHQYEFDDFEGATYWDYIARHTQKDMALQLDVGWAVYAGKSPADYVRKYPSRTYSTHYKVRTADGVVAVSPIIGHDDTDWLLLTRVNVKIGGTRWIIVEQEEYPLGMAPLEAVRASKQGLDAILAHW